MTDRLLEIARKIQQRPWNEPGTDKSWVLRAMWERQRFDREVREAQGHAAKRPSGRSPLGN